MTYSQVVLALWIVALTATFTGLLVALRGLVRAEAATRAARSAGEGVAAVETATASLQAAVTDTAHARVRFHTRTRT